ncbi:MAG: DNA adenine methylase [Planctomycetes bacterium]|nr:DNA adenine methylase [Planctomycetota bacterium]
MAHQFLFPNETLIPANNIPHPIPYQGSKRNLATDILSYCPPKIGRLVEPFAGSAAISLAAASCDRAQEFWINDAHKPLIDLWLEIIERPDQLSDKYESLWKNQLGREREYYDVVRSKFNKTHQSECFLYLLARCVKAAIRYNSSGGFNNSPDNRRKGATPETMRQRITGASQLLRHRTKVTSLDYKDVLLGCTRDDLIYMDPPYQGVCGSRDNRYLPKIDHDGFCETLRGLNKKECLYLVSYDGRTGTKTFGKRLPDHLELVHLEIHAGRSTQATLLGRNDDTYESLYLSPGLVKLMGLDRKAKKTH